MWGFKPRIEKAVENEVYSPEFEWGIKDYFGYWLVPTGRWKISKILKKNNVIINMYVEVYTESAEDKTPYWYDVDNITIVAKPNEEIFECGH